MSSPFSIDCLVIGGGVAGLWLLDELRRQGFRRGLGAASIVVGIAAIAFVFFALPRWVEQEQPARYKPAASTVPAKPAAQEEPKKEVDFAALARAKQDADDRRGPSEERLKKLANSSRVCGWNRMDLAQPSPAPSTSP